MSIFQTRIVCIGIALIVDACSRGISLPKTSVESEQLRWLDSTDVAKDFRDHVAHNHDLRFISCYGLGFGSEFPGLEDTPDSQQLVRNLGSRRIQGTTDIITSTEHRRLQGKAFEYARRYNRMLLGYLATHKNE